MRMAHLGLKETCGPEKLALSMATWLSVSSMTALSETSTTPSTL